jgi:hypothetical protein
MCKQNSYELLWVKSAVSALGRTLPAFPTNRICSAPVGTSQIGPPRKKSGGVSGTHSKFSQSDSRIFAAGTVV